MKKYLILLVAFFAIKSQPLTAQLYDDSFSVQEELAQRVQIPNSPEAQAFAKYGNTTVNLFHGTPNIQIPIYSHPGRELNLPISLTYDASGIKVEQRATNVGLGWNLNLGGRISRVTNGYPDDYITAQTPYLSVWNDTVNNSINRYVEERTLFEEEQDAIDYLVFLKNIKNNYYDTQPDFFSFSALGVSDMIIIDRNTKQAVALNNPRIKVTFNKSNFNGANGAISSWNVVLEDGTILTFARPETTDSENFLDIGSNTGNNDFYGAFKKYNSSWLLTSIISSTGKDHYTFGFTNYFGQDNDIQATFLQGVTNPIVAVGASLTVSSGTNTPSYTIEQSFVNTITHNGKRIVTIDYGTRYDTKGNLETAINTINIYDKDTGNDTEDLNRSVNFLQDYFGTNPPNTLNKNTIRLKLEGLEISYSDPQAQKQHYTFEYQSPDQIPSLLSIAQDYYGYYNGKSNTKLYPKVNNLNIIGINDDGADRTVSTSHTKIGTLNKIIYPTGGHTIFNYDSHKSSYVNPEQTSTVTDFIGYGSNFVQGGTVPNDSPESECTGPACQENTGPNGGPKVSHTTFQIEDEGDYLLSYLMTPTGAHPGPREAIVFKKSNNNSNCSISTLRYDEIKSQGGDQQWLIDPDDIVYWNTHAGGENVQNQNIHLTPGCYQITLVNNSPQSQSNLNIGRYETSTTTSGGDAILIPKAGLRIASTEDYTREGQLALRKEYTYSDGMILSSPKYQSISTQLSGNASAPVETQILHRTSYASGTDKPHVGYPWVIEKVSSDEGNIVSRNSFNVGGGQNVSGVFQYYINNKQTSNNYTTNYAFGKPKRITSTRSIDSLKYYENDHYRQVGIHYTNDESKNFFYPIPTQSPATEKWFILEVPHSIVATYAGGLLGAGLSGLRTMPPPECTPTLNGAEVCNPGIMRMVAYTPSVSGSIGGMLERSSTQLSTVQSSTISVTTEKVYYSYYDSDLTGEPINYLLKSEKRLKTNGDTLVRTYKYPENFPEDYAQLIQRNMVNVPVDITTSINQNLPLNHRRTEYSDLLPSRVLASSKGTALEERVFFDEYRSKNPVQSHTANGVYTAYIWGYDNRYLVAKIDNATYGQVIALSSFTNGAILSEGLSNTQEQELRSLPNALVTTHTYKPNVGLLSTKDTRGYTMYYEYDTQNRLKLVRDENGNILNENQYNYRTNN
jgi:hypothetical protein